MNLRTIHSLATERNTLVVEGFTPNLEMQLAHEFVELKAHADALRDLATDLGFDHRRLDAQAAVVAYDDYLEGLQS